MTPLDTTYIPSESRIVVACSAGGDSVAMLHLLAAEADPYGWELLVAHLDHGLRDESALDADFARQCAESLGLDCVVGERDVRAGKEPGESVEAAARRIRYDFLGSVRDDRFPGGLIATGHTADDQLETVAMRLERGSGLRGLRCIQPCRNDGIVRPLLRARRGQLREWMVERGLEWREDATNEDMTIRRNLWRRCLESLPPGAYDELVNEASVIAQMALRLFTPLNGLAGNWLERRGGLLPGELLLERLPISDDGSGVEHSFLEAALERSGIDPGKVNNRLRRELVSLLGGGLDDKDRESTVLQLGTSVWAEAVPDGLLIARGAGPHWERGSDFSLQLKVPHPGSLESMTSEMPLGGAVEISGTPEETVGKLAGGSTVDGVDGRWKAVFDRDALGGGLIVRYPEAGDRIQPLGMEGHRRLADLFSEEKIPRLTRGRLPVIEGENGIIWVAGVRQSHETRITDATKLGVTIVFQTYY